MRCFIAIDLSESLKKSVNDCIRQLKPLSRDVRWVVPSNLHLTLKFLGEVPDTSVQQLLAVLEPVAQASEPFTLSVTGTGAFRTSDGRTYSGQGCRLRLACAPSIFAWKMPWLISAFRRSSDAFLRILPSAG